MKTLAITIVTITALLALPILIIPYFRFTCRQCGRMVEDCICPKMADKESKETP